MISTKLHLLVISMLTLATSLSGQFDSLSYQGLQRTYLVHLPPSYNGQQKLPLIIAMHGGFGSAANLQNQSGLSHTADDHNFIVVYPEGAREGILNIRTWNAGWCCGGSSFMDIDDVGFIDTLLDVLISQYAIDTLRIYATGMSNGGFMSYRLACELSTRIAAIAPVAASLSLHDCNPERPVPIIHFHSYLDSSVPYAGGIGDGVSDHYNPPLDSVLETWAVKNNCQSQRLTIQDDIDLTKYQWSNCDCSTEIIWYLTKDGGHSWPGGNQTPIGDPPSRAISANELMWDFFSQYSLECNIVSTTRPDPEMLLSSKVFPNPSRGTFKLESSSDLNEIISITDLSGKILPFIQRGDYITVPEFKNGIYLLKLKQSNRIGLIKVLLQN